MLLAVVGLIYMMYRNDKQTKLLTDKLKQSGDSLKQSVDSNTPK